MLGWPLALPDTFFEEDGRELASNHLLLKPWKKQVGQGVWKSCQVLDNFWMELKSHAIKALLSSARTLLDYRKEILFTCIKTRDLGGYVGLARTMPDTELTLTHFEDGRATDENVLEEEAAKSRNLSYQGCGIF